VIASLAARRLKSSPHAVDCGATHPRSEPVSDLIRAPQSTAWTGLSGWQTAHRGLRLYFTAMIVYIAFVIILAVFIASLVVASGLTDEREIMESLLDWARIGGVVAFGIQLAILAALYRYSSVPEPAAREAARLAFYAGVVAMAVDLWLLLEVLFLFDAEALLHSDEIRPGDALSSLLHLLVLFAFLRSLRLASEHLGREDIVRQVLRTRTLLIIVIVAAVLTMIATAAGTTEIGLLGLLGLVVGLGGIAMVVLYLIAVHALARAIATTNDIAGAFD